MRLVSKIARTEARTTGMLSDGSDRVTAQVPVWDVEVVDDAGILRAITFEHDPSAQDLIDACGLPSDIIPTSKAALSLYLRQPYEEWWMWKQLLAEATLRNEPANVRTALTTQVDAAWTALRTAVNSWRTAV